MCRYLHRSWVRLERQVQTVECSRWRNTGPYSPSDALKVHLSGTKFTPSFRSLLYILVSDSIPPPLSISVLTKARGGHQVFSSINLCFIYSLRQGETGALTAIMTGQ